MRGKSFVVVIMISGFPHVYMVDNFSWTACGRVEDADQRKTSEVNVGLEDTWSVW